MGSQCKVCYKWLLKNTSVLEKPTNVNGVDATNHKTTWCYLTPSIINYKNDLKNPSDETLQVVSVLVAYEYKLRVKFYLCLLYIYSTNTVFKAFHKYIQSTSYIVYTKTINNDEYGYTRPWHTYDCLIVHTFECVMRSGDRKRGEFYW